MKEQISNRDWEQISAYLDGQLPPQKQAHLEARLQQDPHLYAALIELKNTRNVLRNTPRLRAPRNFTLTHQMVGQQARSPHLAPIFGWASAIASILLVFIFVGDIFSAGGIIPIGVEGSSEQVVYFDPQSQSAPDTGAMDVPDETNVDDSVSAGGAESSVDTEVPEGDLIPPVAAEPMDVPAPPTQELEIAMAEEVVPEPSLDAARSAESEEATIFAAPPEDVGDNVVETDIEVDAEALVISPSDVITSAYITTTEPEVTEESMAVPQTDETMAKPSGELEEDPTSDWQPQDDTETRAPEPTQEMMAIAEEASQGTYIVTRDSDYILGVEVILVLFILASGIAWIFLRYRGG